MPQRSELMHSQPWRSGGAGPRRPLRAVVAPILLGLAAGLANCSAALPETGNTPNRRLPRTAPTLPIRYTPTRQAPARRWASR